MAEVKWIKVSTSMFETSRKIKQIELMKNGDGILVIWFKLLLLAGSINDGGAIYITEGVPYDPVSLAGELRRPTAIVKQALGIFESYGMTKTENGIIYLTSWDKYQSAEKLELMREYNRIAQQKSRERRKKGKQQKDENCQTNVIDSQENCQTNVIDSQENVNECQGTEERDIIDLEFHSFTLSDTRAGACAGEDEVVENLQKGALMRRYLGGTLGGGVVLLSEAQFDSLCEELSLEELERYLAVVRDCEKKGMRYKKSHYQAILDMAKEDRKV